MSDDASAADLLPGEAREQLVQMCRTTMSDRLRSVTYFTRSDFEQLYLRSDLERDADLSSFIGVEWREDEITQNAYRGTELGDYRYTIRVFENGYLIRVSTDDDGVFVTTDGLTLDRAEEVASALTSLLSEWHPNR